jgi:hypothetical protein
MEKREEKSHYTQINISKAHPENLGDDDMGRYFVSGTTLA